MSGKIHSAPNKERPNQDDVDVSNTSNYKAVGLLKKGIWLYFFLLIFEGALRKWVLPGMSEALLIVRDPVAIVLIIYAWYRNLFPTVSYVIWMFIIAGIAIFTTLFFGHGNLFVTAYGARILLLHFPLIFLIGKIFTRKDVLKMGKTVVWLAIPMAVLISLQFFSPQSAWVNRGVGGIGSAGFSGAMGYFRPPGTFSFTNGTTLYFSLAASYIFYFWLRPSQINKWILIAATLGLIVSIPFSISRGLTFSIAIMVIFALVSVSQQRKHFGQILVAGVGIIILFMLLSKMEFFQTATEVYFKRFENAAVSEGGLEGTLIDRYLGGMVSAISDANEMPFFGAGLGMGTNAGSALLGANRTFLISEGEWGRLVGEMGAILGIAVIFIRIFISFKVSLASFKALKSGRVLSWMLLSFALLVFPQGQWAQPTTLGFSTLIMGLLIASFNLTEQNDEDLINKGVI